VTVPAPTPEPDDVLPHEQVRFAHNSERQFATLLDFYGIEWQYEPRTFPIEFDRLGHPVQAFTPDFHLPAYDLYVEITTLNQRLVTKKNRKARRVRELYGINVKVLYQRDYLGLLVKYGLDAPEGYLGEDLVDVTVVADGVLPLLIDPLPEDPVGGDPVSDDPIGDDPVGDDASEGPSSDPGEPRA
jgi:hypothetical protein